jgi:hypothetical protein
MTTDNDHKAGMTSEELLARVRSKRAEVNKYVEVNCRRRRFLVNLVVVAGASRRFLLLLRQLAGSLSRTGSSNYSIPRAPHGNSCACLRA